jgi:hypothetical protein
VSQTPDGKHRCDACDADVGNGGLISALVVADLDPDNNGHVRNLHFCRDREEGEGKQRKHIKGCARKLIHPATMRAYDKRKETASA